MIPQNGTIPGNFCCPVLPGGEQSLPVPLPHVVAVSWCCSVQEKLSVPFPSEALPFPKGREARVMFSFSPSQGSVSMQSFSCYIFYLPSIFCYRLCIKRSCFFPVKRKNEKMYLLCSDNKTHKLLASEKLHVAFRNKKASSITKLIRNTYIQPTLTSGEWLPIRIRNEFDTFEC